MSIIEKMFECKSGCEEFIELFKEIIGERENGRI